jgi:Mrp family chromosome partitioning ATPase
MRSTLAAPVGRLGCRSRRLGTLAPSVRARYEEEALSRLRATPAIDPALVTVKSVVVRQSGRASCSLEFASAACPQRAEIEAAAQKTLLDAEWVNGCDVEARVRRPPSFMGAKAPPSLQHVGALIGVSSCKGGVGKSTVAVNLAFALAGIGARVGLLDADVHGPSLPSLVALPEGSLPIVQRSDNKLLTPPLVGGVRLMSYGFIAKGASTGRVPAAVMRGPMVGKVVGQMLSGTEWGDLDYLLVDLPPGTGDVQLTLCQTYGLSAALVITTPQRLARVDVEKGIDMFRELAVPIIGLVENMGYFTDGHGEVHHPFGTSQLEAVREYAGVAAHAAFRLPIEAAVSAACDASTPIVVAYPESATAGALAAAAAQLTLDVARLQHAQRGAQAAQLRFDPKRGLVLRVLAGVDEGREFVLPRDVLAGLAGGPSGGGGGGDGGMVLPTRVAQGSTPSGEPAAIIHWEGGGESLLAVEELKRLAIADEGTRLETGAPKKCK